MKSKTSNLLTLAVSASAFTYTYLKNHPEVVDKVKDKVTSVMARHALNTPNEPSKDIKDEPKVNTPEDDKSLTPAQNTVVDAIMNSFQTDGGDADNLKAKLNGLDGDHSLSDTLAVTKSAYVSDTEFQDFKVQIQNTLDRLLDFSQTASRNSGDTLVKLEVVQDYLSRLEQTLPDTVSQTRDAIVGVLGKLQTDTLDQLKTDLKTALDKLDEIRGRKTLTYEDPDAEKWLKQTLADFDPAKGVEDEQKFVKEVQTRDPRNADKKPLTLITGTPKKPVSNENPDSDQLKNPETAHTGMTPAKKAFNGAYPDELWVRFTLEEVVKTINEHTEKPYISNAVKLSYNYWVSNHARVYNEYGRRMISINKMSLRYDQNKRYVKLTTLEPMGRLGNIRIDPVTLARYKFGANNLIHPYQQWKKILEEIEQDKKRIKTEVDTQEKSDSTAHVDVEEHIVKSKPLDQKPVVTKVDWEKVIPNENVLYQMVNPTNGKVLKKFKGISDIVNYVIRGMGKDHTETYVRKQLEEALKNHNIIWGGYWELQK